MPSPILSLAAAAAASLAASPARAQAETPEEPAAEAAAEVFSKEAFRPLFDGRSLAGWVASGGRYDGLAEWTVADGVLTGREGPGGAGGLIYTEALYANFVFAADVWIDWPFDSGIFVRMVPRDLAAPELDAKGAQVTIDYRPGGEVGAIYSDGFLAHNETGAELLRRGAWNHFEVRCTGAAPRVEAWMNGAKLADFAPSAGARGYAERGRIGLQVHGGGESEAGAPPPAARFKNMQILELPLFDAELFELADDGRLSLLPAGRALGWRALLEGSDLGAWEAVGEPVAWTLEDGVLAVPSGAGGYLCTREDFRDFELQIDFKTGHLANSGLFLRGARAGGDPAYSGCEIQILDDFHWETATGSTLQPWQVSGSLYGALAPAVRALYPIGAWNTYQVRCAGARLAARLNGALLWDVDTRTLADAKPPFAERAPAGFIGLQRHSPASSAGEARADDGRVWFRNAFVRPLGPERGER